LEHLSNPLRISRIGRQVSQRQNSNKSVVAIYDQYSPDLPRMYHSFSCLSVVIFVAMDDGGRHRIANRGGSRIATQGNGSDGYVAIGEHADDVVTVADRQWADLHLLHFEGSLLKRVVRSDALDVWCHDVFDFHDDTPVPDHRERSSFRATGSPAELPTPRDSEPPSLMRFKL